MGPGDVVGDRFELQRFVAAGGMGRVFCARDRLDGGLVACKVLASGSEGELASLAREVRALSSLQHPGIARYVAHGVLPDGAPWLATEWLEGEDLARWLRRRRPTVAESVALVARVAEILGAAHDRGVTHRDVKPANLFAVDGRLDRIKVLDFGVARLGSDQRTRTGTVLGTPGYMAPEQARGERDVDARADVFALGVVLYECLAGQAPFGADTPLAMLAKLLFDDPAPLDGALPPELAALVRRLLDKDPAGRPADGHAVAAALRTMATPAEEGPPAAPTSPSRPAATREQRLLSLILVGSGTQPPPDAATVTAAAYGARWFGLPDGGALVVLAGAGAATDQAIRAARCAVALREVAAARPMALVTGLSEMPSASPAGGLVERAVGLIGGGGDGIRLDELTAGLVAERFAVLGAEGARLLGAERPSIGTAGGLLGQPMPCVGRDHEIETLLGLWQECRDEGVARAALVSGPAGLGKSRILGEVLQRIEGRPWIARGDPLSAGSPFAMVVQLVLRAAGVEPGAAVAARATAIERRVAEVVPAPDRGRVSAFLCELVGAARADAADPALPAARRDPQVMGDQLRQAWETFVEAECVAAERAGAAVLVVVEDLHWGDRPSVQLVDAILRRLRDRPLCVLAAARPEVHDVFGRLWADRGLTEVRLGELGGRACSRLVRSVLADLPAERVAALVARSGGNPFFLEELVRGAAAGHERETPATVLSALQARLESLPGDARRVLRAASVFGATFWREGIAAVLTDVAPAEDLAGWLESLAARELILPRGEEHFPGRQAFAFRHALLRDAVYETLAADDRTQAHRRAAAWLTEAGERDAVVLAEHLERGEQPALAADAFRRAAEQALAGNDLAAVIARVARGIACGAKDETRAALQLAAARAHLWRGEYDAALTAAREVVAEAEAGAALWCAGAGEAAMAAGHLGRWDVLADVGRGLQSAAPSGDGVRARREALARAATQLVHAGRYADADALLAELDDADPEPSGAEAATEARVAFARGLRAKLAGDAGRYVVQCARAGELAERAGDLRYACAAAVNSGFARMEVGLWEQAERELQAAIRVAEQLELPLLRAAAIHNLGLVLAQRGDPLAGLALEREAVAFFAERGARRFEGLSLVYAARIARKAGLEEAEALARQAVEVLESVPSLVPYALAVLGVVLAHGDRRGEAVALAGRARAALEALGTAPEGEAFVRWATAEIATAAGDEAAAALRQAAVARLRERATAITEAAVRRTFLEEIEENSRTMRWDGGEARG